TVRVKQIVAGGAASKDGRRHVGDLVRSVADGSGKPEPLAGKTQHQARHLVLGTPGTEVRLEVLPGGTGNPQTIAIIRQPIAAGEVSINCLAFSAESTVLAAGLGGQNVPGQVVLWETNDWRQRLSFRPHPPNLFPDSPWGANGVAFAP